MKYNFITQTEYDFLINRLKELESSEQTALKDLKHALNYGSETWHDNDMFDTAKKKQNDINTEKKEIKNIVKSSKIVNLTKTPKKVVVGTQVTLNDIELDKTLTLSIGGSEAYRIGDNWISLDSPIGKYIKNKSEGEIITVKLPTKVTTYKIEIVDLIDG